MGVCFLKLPHRESLCSKRRYVFSETFAAIAMAEYAIASGEREYAEKALKLFKDIQRFLNTPVYWNLSIGIRCSRKAIPSL